MMNPENNVNQPAYIRYGLRALFISTGILCSILGVFVTISISPACIVAGLLHTCTGLIVLLAEAPFCCRFVPQTAVITGIMQQVGPLTIGIFYACSAVLTVAMCFGLSTIFSCILLIACAALKLQEFILNRRAKRAAISDPERGVAGGIYPENPAIYSTNPPPYSQGPGHVMDRAVEGAVKGATEGFVSGAKRSGGYPGF